MLVVSLGAVAVVALDGLTRQASFDEAVWRFQDALRQARAEAAQTGRRVRIVFRPVGDIDELAWAPAVQWEPLPLAEPGVFVDYVHTGWDDLLTGDLLVLTSRLTGDSAYQTLLSQQLEATEESDYQPVTFYADGSSDSAVFCLAPTDPEDARRVVVVLDGQNNTIRAYRVGDDEAEQYVQAALDGESVAQLHRELYPPGEDDQP